MSENFDFNLLGWQTAPLGDIASIKGRIGWKGYTVADLRQSGILVIGGAQISKGHQLNLKKPVFISKEKYEESPEIKVRSGDLIISKTGTIGNIALIPEWNKKATINPNTAIIRTNGIDNKFLYYFLISSVFQMKLVDLVTVGAQPSLNQKNLKSFKIPIPPLPEQKSIVKILTYCDKLINKLEKQKRIQRNIFIALISDFFLSTGNTIPKVKIGEICKVKRGASPRPIQSTKWWGKGRGWTRISDVTSSHKYLFKTKDHLSQEGEQKSVSIDSGDLILSICATIGLPIIVKTPICIHDGFVWFEGLKEFLEVEYAYYFFSAIRNQLLQGSQRGTQGNLNTSIVSNIEIPLRSIDEQKRISSVLSSTDNNISMTSKKIDKYKNLKRSLIDNLVSGRKRVNI